MFNFLAGSLQARIHSNCQIAAFNGCAPEYMVPKTQRVATKEHGRWCKTVSDSVLQMLRQIGVGGCWGGVGWLGGGRGGAAGRG